MIPSTVNICVFDDGARLVKERHSEGPRFSLRVLIGNHWETIRQWDDPGHVANLLIKAGYESEHLPAIKLLSIL